MNNIYFEILQLENKLKNEIQLTIEFKDKLTEFFIKNKYSSNTLQKILFNDYNIIIEPLNSCDIFENLKITKRKIISDNDLIILNDYKLYLNDKYIKITTSFLWLFMNCETSDDLNIFLNRYFKNLI